MRFGQVLVDCVFFKVIYIETLRNFSFDFENTY